VTARQYSNVSYAELLGRIRAEYLEMPGLQLTAPQARCLFGLDSETWHAVLTALLDAKFLTRTNNGQFAMAAMQAERRAGRQDRRRQDTGNPPASKAV
jgi:hypothetical protein